MKPFGPKYDGQGIKSKVSLEERLRVRSGKDRNEVPWTDHGPDTYHEMGEEETVMGRLLTEKNKGCLIPGGIAMEPEVDPQLENEAISRVISQMKHEFGERIKSDHSSADFQRELWQAIEEALKDEGRAVRTIRKRQELTERIYNLIYGLGPLEPLFKGGYSEIMVSRYDRIFVEEHGKMALCPVRFETEQELRMVLERIVSPIGRTLDDMNPLVDGRLEDGSRFNVVIPPIAIDGAQLTIRRFPDKDLTEEDYLRFGTLDETILSFLKVIVQARVNLIVSGGTGSGKTSLLNLLGNFLSYDPGLAVVTIEDSAELRIRHPNVRRYETRAATAEGKGEVTSRRLVKNTMRVRPDVIIIGEIRDGTMADYLRAASSGHDGCMTTVHSNSPEDLESTIQILFQMAEDYNFSESAIRRLFANAIDVIIQIKRYPDHVRRISQISHVVGYGKRAAKKLKIQAGHPDYAIDEVYLRDIFVWEKTGENPDHTFRGRFVPTGYMPTAILEKARLYGVPIDESIFRSDEDRLYGGQFDENTAGREKDWLN